jgi:hypothetical protein
MEVDGEEKGGFIGRTPPYMRKILLPVLVMVSALAVRAAGAPAPAPSAPPTADSVVKLLQAMHTPAMVDNARKQVHAALQNEVPQIAMMRHLPPEDVTAMQKEADKLGAEFDGFLDWKNVEPNYVKAFTDTFTQEQVNAMTEFYLSPVGQTMVAKLPGAMQKAGQNVQPQMMAEYQKIQGEFQQFLSQLEAKHTPPAAAKPAGTAAAPAAGTPAK